MITYQGNLLWISNKAEAKKNCMINLENLALARDEN